MEEVEEELDAEYVDFEDVLDRSDFITVHTPLTPETEGMFGAEEFKKMNDHAIIVNTARGPIIDENALAEAIKEGEVRGAAIDTFENEPNVNPGLAEIEEFVVLTPHIRSACQETRLKMVRMAAENVNAGLKGEELPNIVNQEVL